MMCEAYTVMDLLPPVAHIERVWLLDLDLLITLSLLTIDAIEVLELLLFGCADTGYRKKLFGWLRKQRGDRMEAPRHHLGTEDIYIGRDVLERIVDGSEKPSNLKFLLLQLITKFFSDELKLGHGGCGVVYKGILGNRIIAVKRLSSSHTIEDRMFYQEVQSLMRVKHQNIVHFLGYCSHTEEQALELSGNLVMAQLRERLLCFEYINNGSLRDILTDELRGLDWHTRYQIIKGICEGLHHLHKENHIIHMDLKPSNILLDDQMVPKIIDFGLSRLDDKSRTMTVERLITLGYCAPEYQDHGKMSPKSDIYSLGIIVKELVTGSKEKPSIPKVLRRWKHRWNKSANRTPPLLWYKQVSKCLELAIRCTDTKPTNRPDIWDIICELNKVDSGSDVSDAAEWLELEGMIGVEPLEIHLPLQLNKKISCSIELSNNETNGYDFAFMISTTSLRPYCMDPDRGIVPLGSKCSITITLQELEREPPHDYCRDEFSVQSTRVYGNHASSMDMDITQDVFNEEPGKVVDNVDLIVVLDVPPSSTSDQ
ncbi:probable serine/threonine-protein kinase PBL25 [Miscanthus floridulus]|uniref:probable serine/threonine-protein kinase PBL25 n=1 Tax=Miscanthus floridulus TaxID=154761 RepID=UPI0034579720